MSAWRRSRRCSSRSRAAGPAYQSFGGGPATIVAVPPLAQNIELSWEWPAIRAMLERLGSFSRFVHFDKRGTGASDRAFDVPGVDQRIDDPRAVMDAAGVERAHLFGVSEGGPMTLLFAATYPDRVEGVTLYSTSAGLADHDVTPEQRRENREQWQAVADAWGTPNSPIVDDFAPSLAADDEFRRWHQRYERQSATSQQLMTLLAMNGEMDASEVLHQVTVPVLMFQRVDDAIAPIRLARDTAVQLPNARLIELPGRDHFTYATDIDTVMNEIERFVTGTVVPTAVPCGGSRRRFAHSVDSWCVSTARRSPRRSGARAGPASSANGSLLPAAGR